MKVKRRGESNYLMDRIKFCEEGSIGFGPNVDKIQEDGEGEVSSREKTGMNERQTNKKPQKIEGHVKVTNSQK